MCERESSIRAPLDNSLVLAGSPPRHGTTSSNLISSSGESGTNHCAGAFFVSANHASEERRRGMRFSNEPSACGWDQEFESPLLQRRVRCEPEFDRAQLHDPFDKTQASASCAGVQFSAAASPFSLS